VARTGPCIYIALFVTLSPSFPHAPTPHGSHSPHCRFLHAPTPHPEILLCPTLSRSSLSTTTHQKLLAVQMGGAIYSHVAVEGKPAGSVGGLVFLAISCAVCRPLPPPSSGCSLSSFPFSSQLTPHTLPVRSSDSDPGRHGGAYFRSAGPPWYKPAHARPHARLHPHPHPLPLPHQLASEPARHLPSSIYMHMLSPPPAQGWRRWGGSLASASPPPARRRPARRSPPPPMEKPNERRALRAKMPPPAAAGDSSPHGTRGPRAALGQTGPSGGIRPKNCYYV
jgi:hypothetical protein